ncbi:hypothetical protein KP509_11G085100 [Ceratopteris richardii]|uniref:C2 domain-containing protein n=1 Tax=Ceratopteris richardii TaxID=49495 RepID=A0A8T2TWR4_CERRI|nr:hypothetical protein KP509_11G085100 [Ceratopteris richardii]
MEAFRKSDPYAVLTCGARSNPVWTETLLEKKGKDELMGTVRVPQANIVYSQKQVPPTKYKVELANRNFHGELEVHLKFYPKKSYKGTLNVKLLEGHDLISVAAADKIIDPYAMLKCDSQQHKITIMKNAGASLVWNETFVFKICGNASNLEVALFDKDTFSKDDPLGNVTIPL